MRFLIDAQLPPALRRWIEAPGQSALHVMDIGLLAIAKSQPMPRLTT